MRAMWCVSTAMIMPLAVYAAQALKGELRVEVSEVRGAKGQVGCLVFTKAHGFPKNAAQAAFRQLVKPVNGRAVCAFTQVPAGAVAVSVMHDENNNGKLDTNFFGAPKEGYGFSHGAKAHTFSPPTFDEARVPYNGSRSSVQITLNYR